MGPPGAKGEFPTVYRRFERAVLEPLGTLRLRVPCHDEQDEAKFDSVVVGGGYFINVLQPDGTLNRTLLDVDVFANAPSTELRSDRDDPAWDIGIVNKTTLERHTLVKAGPVTLHRRRASARAGPRRRGEAYGPEARHTPRS